MRPTDDSVESEMRTRAGMGLGVAVMNRGQIGMLKYLLKTIKNQLCGSLTASIYSL